jgi:SAM-dependent methyltransferase
MATDPREPLPRPIDSYPRYRRQVGPPQRYDLIAAMQFNLLTTLGLREEHYLLDVGCGSLRGGRLFIPYLLPGRYFGIEPDQTLVDEGLDRELGRDILTVKEPSFEFRDDFKLSVFGRDFDFILAQSIFSHATAGQINTCLAEAAQVLSPGGTMAATFYEGEDNYDGDTWVFPGRVFYRFDYRTSDAQQAGLQAARIDGPHPGLQNWLRISHPG